MLGAHAHDELEISEITTARPVQAALTSAASFSVGAAMPVLMVVVARERACPHRVRCVIGFSRFSGRDWGKSRRCKRFARHSPSDILGRLGDGSNRRYRESFRHRCLKRDAKRRSFHDGAGVFCAWQDDARARTRRREWPYPFGFPVGTSAFLRGSMRRSPPQKRTFPIQWKMSRR
jgi:VIT family